MSELYFTSAFLPANVQGKFRKLEDVFNHFDPDDIILIFDTNVVIEFRNYYFNPTSFTSRNDRVTFLKDLRNLVKGIHKYNLEVNASFGVEESSREPESFELNMPKLNQTRDAVIDMFYTDASAFDRHFIDPQNFGEEIKFNSQYSLSKIECLYVPSTFQHLLIISYLLLLKIVDLYFDVNSGSKDKLVAFEEFVNFMQNDVDLSGGMHLNYAVHLFGRAPKFQTLWKKKAKTREQKLHNIFNASIDLITPTIADKMQNVYDQVGDRKLLPVFVTSDNILSDLYSLQKVLLVFDETPGLVSKNYMPQFTYYEFLEQKLEWTNDEYNKIKELSLSGSQDRLDRATNKGRDAFNLIPLVKELEDKVKLRL